MLFNSLPFLAGFLPVVLIVTVGVTKFGGRRAGVLFLLIASLGFYAYAFPPHLLLLLFSIFANYLFGLQLARKPNGAMLSIAVSFNLGLLGWFKYAGFFAESFSALSGVTFAIQVVLPLAISFFTFQQIAYLVDIRRGEAKPHGFLDYCFFVGFFPQLIAGPIVHHRHVIPQLSGSRFLRFHGTDLTVGFALFAIGLSKKVLIADNLRFTADRIFDAASLGVEPSFTEAWVGILCYSFQIYFDFSGYSDMALGLGRIFGLRLPKNFESPYKAGSIIEFWRRWNITLSHFLRDYLYFPLGGNRNGTVMRYLNLFIVMLLGGLWHGASWTFVVWGGLHGAYLALNHAWRYCVPFALPRFANLSLTFVAVCFAWVFFRAGSFDEAFVIVRAMSGLGTQAALSAALLEDLATTPALFVFAALVTWLAPNSLELVKPLDAGRLTTLRANLLMLGTGTATAFAIFTIFFAGSYEFIYFQF